MIRFGNDHLNCSNWKPFPTRPYVVVKKTVGKMFVNSYGDIQWISDQDKSKLMYKDLRESI